MKKTALRVLLVLAAAMLLYAFFANDLGSYLSLEYLKSQKQALDSYTQENFTRAVLMFFSVYVVATALSVPGATVLTLAAGAMFGLIAGVVIVSFASTIGATLAFLASRFLLKDYVQQKFGDKLRSINQGMEKDGSFYLFTLRLIPLFPFFMINLVMGLMPISAFRFFWVSQIGMLAGTFVYVNAGSQLAQIDSMSAILSPALLLSFVLLGVFPLVARKLLDLIKRNRVYKGFKKPASFDYNLLVIGGGSAGLVSAYIAAAVKAKVALVEKHKMGGDCLNTGCVPSKALIRSASVLALQKRATEFGLNSLDAKYEFSDVMDRVQRVIKAIEPHDSVERYSSLGVDVIQGEAKMLSPWEVQIGDKSVTAANLIVATGARPFVPDIEGLSEVNFHTSDSIWDIRERPSRMLVVGGGPIGCELAQCFQRLGSKVTLVQRDERILPREDSEISEMVRQRFESEGMNVLLSHEVVRFAKTDSEQVAILNSPQGEVSMEFDLVLIALGRAANVSGFGLEPLGIDLSARKTIEADEFLRTKYPNIFVCGDVTGPYQFTHVASHQAWYASVNALFGLFKKFRVDYSVIPWATYTDPEVARVGLNELEAQERGVPYELTSYGIDDLDRAIADEEAVGVVKVLTVPGKDKILGVTIVGAHSADLIAEFVLAMKHGLGLNKILGTIHIYPTMAEANKYAAGVWKRNHKPEKLLNWVARYHAWRR